MLEVRTEDVLWYADHSLDEMVAILRQLGDETANRRPRLPGANSPFAIVTHCLGVMEFWAGAVIADRPIVRDRDAEFSATGAVEELVTRTAAARRQLAVDLESLAPLAPPRRPGPARDAHLPFARTQGGVVLHILEELMQHLGQLELTRDLLDAERTAPST
ncbi:MAG: DinB family protein [Acidimicrobiales bacterium]